MQYLLLMFWLFSFKYTRDVTLGVPDTNRILVNPINVAEKNDTIIVLDKEERGQYIKEYTIDGFFVKARSYDSLKDYILFPPSNGTPPQKIVEQANNLVSKESNIAIEYQTWEKMFVESDSTIWLVCSWVIGDAGGLAIIAFKPNDTLLRASGYGPIGSAYQRNTMRGIERRIQLYVSKRYVYLIAGEFLWQYDRQVRFIRQIGIKPNNSFKEPYGIAINGDIIYITDFRLGIIWECRPGLEWSMIPLINENLIPQESPTFITFSSKYGLWMTDIRNKRILNIGGKGFISRSYTLKELTICPGGTNFKIAFSDSMILIHEVWHGRVFVYDLYCRFLRKYEATDYEGKKDALLDMDNYGNCYFFNKSYPWQYLRINSAGTDTFPLVLPDSSKISWFDWWRCYRTDSILYVFSRYFIASETDKDTATRGFLIFINDTLIFDIPESEFEGGLPERITDFALQSYGLFWVVDINRRLVQRYKLLPQIKKKSPSDKY